jgi:hypothetical protein
MEILKIHEPVGDEKYCKMECEFTEEETEMLLSYAVTNLLKEQIKRMEDECEQGTVGDWWKF